MSYWNENISTDSYPDKMIYFTRFVTLFFLVLSTHTLLAQSCFPADQLPSHITQLTDFGQRAEWSLDGKYLYFVDRAGGEVWRVNIDSKQTQQITQPEDRPDGHGYYRVVALANGDLLLGGGAERHHLYFRILDGSLTHPPRTIAGEALDEGPAVSRKTMKIAWTLPGQRQIYAGEIAYDRGKPQIVNKRLIVDSVVVTTTGERFADILESQNWRPPQEEELIFSQYQRGDAFRSETMGINLTTGDIINYSQSPATYEEPEGIFPDGESTLMESDKHHPTSGTNTIEVYRLALDSTGQHYQRLTFFSKVPGFRASNPVVSDDGRYIAFQGSHAESNAGAGCGLYLFDLHQWEESRSAK